MELIDRGALLQRLEQFDGITGIGLETLIAVRDVKYMVSSMPAVDAVPVVQCKDCKWYDTENGFFDGKDGFCPNLGACIEADWFCADGERKDGV